MKEKNFWLALEKRLKGHGEGTRPQWDHTLDQIVEFLKKYSNVFE